MSKIVKDKIRFCCKHISDFISLFLFRNITFHFSPVDI